MRRADIEVPNHAVDMDSWARSLLSLGYLLPVERPRTHVPWPDHCSRCTCSTRRSHSQVLHLHSRHLITNQLRVPERLPAILGGNRPVKLTHQALSLTRAKVGRPLNQNGISTIYFHHAMAVWPAFLTYLKSKRTPMSSYSKGPKPAFCGMSIFTFVLAISLSSRLMEKSPLFVHGGTKNELRLPLCLVVTAMNC